MNNLSIFLLIIWYIFIMVSNGIKMNIFYNIYPGMEWSEAKEKIEIVQPESEMNTLSFGHSYVIGCSWYTSYEIRLPNNIVAYVVLDSEFLSYEEKAKILYIYTKDPKFEFNGIKISMTIDKVKEFLVDPSICFQDSTKSIVDVNGLKLDLGKWSPKDAKLVWKSDRIQTIGHLSVQLVKEKLVWKNHYVDKEYNEWCKEKEESKENR